MLLERATTRVKGTWLLTKQERKLPPHPTPPPPVALFQNSHWAELPCVSRPSQVSLLLEVLPDPQGKVGGGWLPHPSRCPPADASSVALSPCRLALWGQPLLEARTWFVIPATLGDLTPPIALPLLLLTNDSQAQSVPLRWPAQRGPSMQQGVVWPLSLGAPLAVCPPLATEALGLSPCSLRLTLLLHKMGDVSPTSECYED